MIELVVDNVYTEIKYASNDIEFKIWNKLAFEIQEYNSLQIPQIRHLFNRKTKKTYTGLLEYVLEILDENGEEYIIIDHRIAWEPNAEYSLVKYLDKERTVELKARDYQQHVVDNCRPRAILQMSTGSGKSCALDTDLLTSNGWKKMRDIHPGDVVFDENGVPTQVLSESYIQYVDEYEITFKDDTKIRCCKDHLWKYTTRSFQFNTDKYRVATTEELMKYGVYEIRGRKLKKTYKLAVPVNKPIQFEKKELIIPPYLLGALIGDGHFGQNITFINPEEDLIEKVKQLTIENNLGEFVTNPKYPYRYKNILLLSPKLKEYIHSVFGKDCKAIDKFIPQEYLFSSIEDRLELVRGLIDTDGNIDKKGHISFCTISKKLAEDFKFLVRSLGYRISLKSIDNRASNTAYDLIIWSDDDLLFTSKKHKERFNNRKKANKKHKYNVLKIKDIKKLDTKAEMKCITVDSPEHTYICGRELIVTHNTFTMAALIAKFNVKPVSIFADKISLCTQLKNEFEKFLGEPIGLVGGGIRDIKDITVFSTQSATEDLVKDTKFMLVDECLTYDTLVQMSGGIKKPIGEIVEGDYQRAIRVLSYNIDTGEKEFKTVTNFYKIPIQNKKLMLILIQVNNKMIRISCTDDHKFYIVNKKIYIQAKELLTNYEVLIFDNGQLIIGKVFKSVISFKSIDFVYDIEVADNHNFFANGVLVHNCHHLPCNMLSSISKWCVNAYYRVGVSATPWRDDGADLLIDAVCNRQYPETRITASELILKNYLVPCTIYWVRQAQRVPGNNYSKIYREAIITNKERNKNIVKIAYQMRKMKDSIILILLQRIEHGEILLRMLQKYISNKSFFVDVFTSPGGRANTVKVNEIEFLSGDDNLAKRTAVLNAVRNKQCKILLGTTIFDEGLDIPSADCLILAGAGKSSTRALQRIGRVLRKHPGKERAYIFDFLDSTPIFRRQAAVRKKLYKTESEFNMKDLPAQLLDFDLTSANE